MTSAADTPLFLVDVDGNAAAIVLDRHRAVGVQDHIHPVAMAGQRFVDRVVDDFVHHVMQARAVIGVADIHARPLAHGVKATQDLDGIGAVIRLLSFIIGHFLSHFSHGNSVLSSGRIVHLGASVFYSNGGMPETR